MAENKGLPGGKVFIGSGETGLKSISSQFTEEINKIYNANPRPKLDYSYKVVVNYCAWRAGQRQFRGVK